MRVEYMRSLASAHRWPEEVDLLCEEMARTLTFFTYEEVVWLQRALSANCGPRAFALRKARERRRIRDHFQRMWSVFGDSNALAAARLKRRKRKLQGKKASTEANGDADDLAAGDEEAEEVEGEGGDDNDDDETE